VPKQALHLGKYPLCQGVTVVGYIMGLLLLLVGHIMGFILLVGYIMGLLLLVGYIMGLLSWDILSHNNNPIKKKSPYRLLLWNIMGFNHH
jgi:hypothetical protein